MPQLIHPIDEAGKLLAEAIFKVVGYHDSLFSPKPSGNSRHAAGEVP